MTANPDKTADFLLRQIRFLRRVGDAEHKRDANRWEKIIRDHAKHAATVDFATGRREPSIREIRTEAEQA